MRTVLRKFFQLLLSVPVRVKVLGIMIIPILILGLALNYWITTGLSDWLAYLIPDESVELAMQAGSRSVILVSIIAAAGAILLTLMLMFLLTQPLVELKNTAQEVAEGDLSSRAKIWSKDEIGEVAGAFNDMLNHLATIQQNLESSNHRLQLMNEVVLATAAEDDFHDQLHLILNSILNAAGLEQGWIYLYNQEKNQFHLATWHGVPDDQKEPLLQSNTSVCCSCQEKLLAQSTPHSAVLSPCDRGNKTDEKNEIHHLSLPLHDHQQLLGIVNLRIPENYQRQEELDEMISWIQPQLSEFTSKAWLELKLDEEERSRNKLMKALIQAQEDERSRLAKELHDGAGQMLTGLLIQMKALQGHTEDPDTARKLNHLTNNVSSVIEYIRKLSYQNHPAVLYELGLEGAIINLVEDSITPAGVECSLEIELNKVRLPKEIEYTLYRIIQECSTNLVRHADADHCSIRIWNDAGILQLEFIDDGQGMDADQISLPNHQGVGLSSIKERLSILGGELIITSEPEDGTSIYAKLPLLDEIYEN